MSDRKETALMSGRDIRSPLTLLRQMTSELDRMFEGDVLQWCSRGESPYACWL